MDLLADGYRFISKRCQQYQTKVFETRVMLQKAVCMQGEEASRLFYEPDRFTRKGAVPPNTLKLLQDIGSVQSLDGEDHLERKRMFLAMMKPDSLQRLSDIFAEQWLMQLDKWVGKDSIIFLPEVQDILTRAVCIWADVPLTEPQAKLRRVEFASMISGAGSVGLRNWWGLFLRNQNERWAEKLISGIRETQKENPSGSPLEIIVWHRDREGKLLDVETAAVELINILRPTVAVAWYLVFVAHALHEHPECKIRLQSGDPRYLEAFVQEVRRFYPFFPFIAGRATTNFEWHDYVFKEGSLVLFDIYGTNHDPDIWKDPEAFRPERFMENEINLFSLVAQGAGDVVKGHRCPGEWIAIELMKRSAHLLTNMMMYDIPEQDLSIDFSRMPAIPKSKLIMSNIQRVAQPVAPDLSPVTLDGYAPRSDFAFPGTPPLRENMETQGVEPLAQ
ncbi:cytochrome P450 [Oligoflexus tunisiensis]|uniref:cytochrome P450 n=1 Tax=Oligoflexus tunisiensis TaxID=708132 RepID=UPI001C406212|nr:cytochrome P450 [Oligoflexus tunisiensis]